jgi:hypothetical protein
MTIEIVDLPIKNCDFPSFFVSLPEGISSRESFHPHQDSPLWTAPLRLGDWALTPTADFLVDPPDLNIEKDLEDSAFVRHFPFLASIVFPHFFYVCPPLAWHKVVPPQLCSSVYEQ